MDINNDEFLGIIGALVLLLILGVFYVSFVSVLTYLIIAGLAYTFGLEIPPYVPYAIVCYAIIRAIHKFYKEVKS